jgi:hypothetical protein
MSETNNTSASTESDGIDSDAPNTDFEIDSATVQQVTDQFDTEARVLFGEEFEADLDRMVEAARDHLTDVEYDEWGPLMEHELRASLRRMLIMETPPDEIYRTLRIADFDAVRTTTDQSNGRRNRRSP